MDKNELTNVAGDLFRVVELKNIEIQKLKDRITGLEKELESRPTMRAADAFQVCVFCGDLYIGDICQCWLNPSSQRQ